MVRTWSGQNHLARLSERGRRPGRQKKRWEDNIKEWTGLEVAKSQRWEDNIKEWTGLEFAKSQRAMENTGKWRKLAAKSSVVS